MKKPTANPLLTSLSATAGIGLLGGLGALVGAWTSGHWAAILAGGFLGLGLAAAAGCSLLLAFAPPTPAPKPALSPMEDLWLSDHERWDRIYDRLARSQQPPRSTRPKRERPKSRPPLAR